MMRRAIPGWSSSVAGVAGIIAIGRDEPVAPDAYFATPAGAWMPAVNDEVALTGSWFCPGVPASGEDGVGGEVVISNRADEQLVGSFSILTADGRASTEERVVVEPWSQTVIDVDAFVTAPFASVVVEIEGGTGLVEQRALHPAGDSVAPCANNTSDTWYFADGFTVDGSIETLILTNPYDDTASVDLKFATAAGESTPAAFQGFTVPPRSVRTIPIAELGARDESVIAVEVAAQRGRLVVGRAQHYLGGGRLGYGVTLAAPALRDQWWFADGEQGDGVTETFAIYNPTDTDVQVDAVFLGLPIDAAYGDTPPIDVPANQVVVFDQSDEATAGALARWPSRNGVLHARGSVGGRRARPDTPGGRLGGHVGGRRCASARRRLCRVALAHRNRSVGTDAASARGLQRRQRRRARSRSSRSARRVRPTWRR